MSLEMLPLFKQTPCFQPRFLERGQETLHCSTCISQERREILEYVSICLAETLTAALFLPLQLFVFPACLEINNLDLLSSAGRAHNEMVEKVAFLKYLAGKFHFLLSLLSLTQVTPPGRPSKFCCEREAWSWQSFPCGVSLSTSALI